MGSLRVRRKRRITKFRLHKPKWVDPYPQIPGTLPEKMLFAALVARGIYFIFQGELPKLPGVKALYTLTDPMFKPDIVIPEYGVILDPYAEFHHSQPESVKRDVEKFVYYTGQGYHYYFPWASGITTHGAETFLATVTELRAPPRYPKLVDPRDVAAKRSPGYRLGEFLGAGASSVGAANRRRAKPGVRVLRGPRGR